MVGVLRQQPCVAYTVLPGQAAAWPPVLPEDVGEAISVHDVGAQPAHALGDRQALAETPACRLRQSVTHLLVFGSHGRQLLCQPLVHQKLIISPGASGTT
ncbi:MAG: hypothetical protein JO168_25395 [Solirubrobacterales bacterium]|nr:hypothetical protein [Solirubrobacterales bacterium]